MFILGLILIAAGALAIVAAGFDMEGSASVLGTHMSAFSAYMLGIASALAVLVGVMLMRFAAGRALKRRRERKQLTELSEKLDAVESERAEDDDHHSHRRD